MPLFSGLGNRIDGLKEVILMPDSESPSLKGGLEISVCF